MALFHIDSNASANVGQTNCDGRRQTHWMFHSNALKNAM